MAGLFISLEAATHPEKTTIDSDADGKADLVDLIALIDYLSISFTAPAECR